VRWRGDLAEEAFTIKCRTEELLRQWQRTIMKAVEESPHRRRAHHLSSSRRSERGLNSPLSQFPATPLSEAGPSLYSYSETSSPYPYVSSAQPAYPPNSNGFDDDGDDYREHSESGRSTPSGMARRGASLRSIPSGGEPAISTRNASNSVSNGSSSAAINQWRSQTPGSRNGSPPHNAMSRASIDSEGQSLRSSASNRHLRNHQSVEYGGGSSPVLNSNTRLPSSSSAGLSYSHYDEDPTIRPQGITRQTSHAVAPSSYPAPPMLRNRSTSSPIVYQSPAPGSGPLTQEEWRPYPEQQRRLNSNGQYNPSATLSKSSHATNSGGTLASASSASTPKRFSSSSAGTDRSSGTSSQSAGATYTASTSPATTLPPSGALPALPGMRSSGLSSASMAPTAIRVKVTFGEDTFVVVVLSSVSYRELLEKVLKKIRLCGGDKLGRVEGSNLRLRYRDEDGDKILITSEEDVGMAFEGVRPNEQGTTTLILFVEVAEN
jgi:cell division control protein 24